MARRDEIVLATATGLSWKVASATSSGQQLDACTAADATCAAATRAVVDAANLAVAAADAPMPLWQFVVLVLVLVALVATVWWRCVTMPTTAVSARLNSPYWRFHALTVENMEIRGSLHQKRVFMYVAFETPLCQPGEAPSPLPATLAPRMPRDDVEVGQDYQDDTSAQVRKVERLVEVNHLLFGRLHLVGPSSDNNVIQSLSIPELIMNACVADAPGAVSIGFFAHDVDENVEDDNVDEIVSSSGRVSSQTLVR